MIQSIDFILSSFQNSALAGSANSGIRVVATRTLHKAISNLFAAKFSVSASLSGAREKREKNVRIDCIYADNVNKKEEVDEKRKLHTSGSVNKEAGVTKHESTSRIRAVRL